MKLKTVLPLSLAAVLVPTLSMAAIETVDVEVNGWGKTPDKAIEKGLLAALSQVHGLSLSSERMTKLESVELHVDADDGSSTASVSRREFNEQIKAATGGSIVGYTVISAPTIIVNAQYETTLNVSVAKYVSDRSAPAKTTLVVSGFETRSAEYEMGDKRMLAERLQDDLAAKVGSGFSDSKRFFILSRSEDDGYALEKEKEYLRAEALPLEMARFGQAVGADFLITGTIREFHVLKPERQESLTTGAISYAIPRAYLRVHYKVLDVATREIIKEGDADADLSADELKPFGGAVDRAYNELLGRVATEIASAMDGCFPIRLVGKVPGEEEVAINETFAKIKIGSMWAVSRKGARVQGSSGESYGRITKDIAIMKIVRKDGKFSYGEIISGAVSEEDIALGCVIRPLKKKAAPKPPPGGATVLQGGGVVLPF